jgi:hypothetical protein
MFIEIVINASIILRARREYVLSGERSEAI